MNGLNLSNLNATAPTLPQGTFYPNTVTCTAWAGKENFIESFADFGLNMCNSLAAGKASYYAGWMGGDHNGFVVAADYEKLPNTTFVLYAPETNTVVQNCTTAVKTIIEACMHDNERLFNTGLWDFENSTFDATTGVSNYTQESYMFGFVHNLSSAGVARLATMSVQSIINNHEDELSWLGGDDSGNHASYPDPIPINVEATVTATMDCANATSTTSANLTSITDSSFNISNSSTLSTSTTSISSTSTDFAANPSSSSTSSSTSSSSTDPAASVVATATATGTATTTAATNTASTTTAAAAAVLSTGAQLKRDADLPRRAHRFARRLSHTGAGY